jgi:hypothetical protein
MLVPERQILAQLGDLFSPRGNQITRGMAGGRKKKVDFTFIPFYRDRLGCQVMIFFTFYV